MKKNKVKMVSSISNEKGTVEEFINGKVPFIYVTGLDMKLFLQFNRVGKFLSHNNNVLFPEGLNY